MLKTSLKYAASLAVLATVAGPALAQESWTMTTTWPSSLELIETDKHFVELANKLDIDTGANSGTVEAVSEVFARLSYMVSAAAITLETWDVCPIHAAAAC